MGTVKSAEQLLREVLEASVPLVLDADALNLIAASKTLQARLPKRGAPCVLTPHPAEAARLLGCTTAAVQADRIKAAAELAQRYRAVVVLKGNGSIIASAGRQAGRSTPAATPAWHRPAWATCSPA